MDIDIFGHLPCVDAIPPNVKWGRLRTFLQGLRLNIYFRRILLYASIHTILRNHIAG